MTTESNENHGHGEIPLPEETADPYAGLTEEEQLLALRKDVEEARQDATQHLDTAQRAQAELVNYRRRTDEERLALSQYSNSRLIGKLLPVMEELDLAVSHADTTGPTDSWLEGVKLIQRKLLGLLESEGLASIEAEGTVFNPLEHEAVSTEETTEYPEGYVMRAVRPGYRLHDRVIQPAQVIVAKGPQERNQEQGSSEPQETENG